jgi:lipopolysaccharide export system protein LptC
MSELADRMRAERRVWAAAGSSHDRLIGILRVVLPVAVGMLIAFLALAPLTVGRDISFVLSKDRVDVAGERMRVTHATYRGQDEQGEPFRIDAASAVQQSSRDPIVHLRTLNARIAQRSGPTTIRGDRGRYNLDTRRLAIDGPVALDGSGGFTVRTANVLVDLDNRDMVSQRPVSGTMPLGSFAAPHAYADFDHRVVILTGRARLHIVQARSRRAP